MRRLAWFAAGFAAACLWACYFAPAPLLLPAALLLPVSFGWWQASRPRPGGDSRPRRPAPRYQLSRRLLALSLGMVLAFGWAAAYDALFRAPADRWAGEEVLLSGEIASCPVPTSVGGYAVTVHLDGGFFAPDVLAYGPSDWGGLTPGDHAVFPARVASSARTRRGETTYYTARGVYLLAYCKEAPEVVPAPRVPLRYWPALCARALRAGIDTAFDETAAPIAAAVALGDKAGLDGTLYSAFNRAGLMHGLVVSGLHISFLVQMALSVFGRRRGVALAVIPCLLFYALMAGGTPSALRAALMQSALLLAPLARREEDGPSALAAALMILLLQNPFAAASVGLQLSFASVAGILLVSRPLSRWMAVRLDPLRPQGDQLFRRVLWRAADMAQASVSASLGAMLFTVPLIAWYFGQILLLSPLSNLLALWALSLLMMSALVLGTLAIFLPGPAACLGMAAGLLGHYARWMVLQLGRFPFASLSADNRYCLIVLGAAYVMLAGALCGKSRPRPWLPAVTLALLLCAAIGLGRLEVETAGLTVTALDVGQGSSTALLSGGAAALVDCGGDASRSAGDIAADYFAAMGRTKLDLLVLTHFDADHFNGTAQLFYRMDVRRVAIPSGSAGPEDEALLRALAAAEGAELLLVDETRTLPLGNAVLTLYPPLGGGTSNESGLFALCTCGGFDALITGDADAFVERMLIKYHPIPDVELLLVGHHGSAGSSCEEFLRAAAPELAVISAGAGNLYGHPAEETLARLEALGAEIHRTDLEGSITVRVRGDAVGVY